MAGADLAVEGGHGLGLDAVAGQLALEPVGVVAVGGADGVVGLAGAALLVGGRAADLREGVGLAADALSSGAAASLLDRVREVSAA